MAGNIRATQEKRRREKLKVESRQEKERTREHRKEQKKLRSETRIPGVDPDLIGIYPGPQPVIEE